MAEVVALLKEAGACLMLYSFLYSLHDTYGIFNVFRYITFRAVIAALTALLVSFLFGPWLIRRLTARQIGQQIRPDGPERHLAKAGTPTMGGTTDPVLADLGDAAARRSDQPLHLADLGW